MRATGVMMALPNCVGSASSFSKGLSGRVVRVSGTISYISSWGKMLACFFFEMYVWVILTMFSPSSSVTST